MCCVSMPITKNYNTVSAIGFCGTWGYPNFRKITIQVEEVTTSPAPPSESQSPGFNYDGFKKYLVGIAGGEKSLDSANSIATMFWNTYLSQQEAAPPQIGN